MNFRWLANLRARLLMLVAICVMPFIAMLVYQAVKEYQLTVTNAYRSDDLVLAQVRRRLLNEERRAADTLSLLVRLPSLQSDPATCSRNAAMLIKKLSDFINLGTIDPDGTVRCTAVPLPLTLNVATHSWFRAVLKVGHFAHGPFRFMGITKQVGMVFGTPVFGPHRQIVRVVFLSLPISAVEPDEDLLGANDLTLTAFGRNGKVLVRLPLPGRSPLATRSDARLFAAFKDSAGYRHGILPDPSGVRRFYSLLKLQTGGPGSEIYLAAGVNKTTTDDRALSQFLRRLAGLAALTLAIMLGMWILSTFFLRRQLQTVIDTLGKVGTGNFQVRSGLESYAGEIGDLARGVRAMADELDKLDQSRRESEGRYRALIEQSVDGIVVCNKTGTIRYANDAFCELSGYSRTALLNERIGNLLDKTGNSILNKFLRAVPDPKPHKECRVRHSDGSLVAVECTFCNLDTEELEVTLRDIGERKQAELQLARQKDLYKMLSLTNEAIVQIRDRSELFTTICRIVVEHGGLLVAMISHVDEEGRMHSEASYGHGSDVLSNAKISSNVSEPEGRGPSGRAIRSKRHVIVDDFLQDLTTSAWHDLAQREGIRSSGSFPIIKNNIVIGILGLYSASTGFFTKELQEAFIQVADDVSFALESYTREDEREQAITATRRSEQQFRMLVQATSEIVWITDPAGGSLRISGSLPNRVGLKSHKLSGLDLARMVHPDDRGAAATAWQQALAECAPLHTEYRLRMTDGDYRWFAVRGVPMVADDGQVNEWIGICIDIHDRKVAELDLRNSRRQYRELVEKSIDGIYLRRADGHFLFVNPALCKMLGYHSDELLNMSILDVMNANDPRISGFLERASNPEELPAVAPGQLRHRDGHWVPVESAVKQLDDGRIQAVVRDVTERRHAERQLVEEQRFIVESINSIPGLFYVCDEQRRFLRWNQRFEWITGYSKREIEQMPPEAIIAPEHRALMGRKITQVFNSGEADVEVDLLTRDGRQIPYYFNGRSFRWQGKICLAGVGVDISSRKQAENLAKNYLNRTRNLSRRLLTAQEQERHDIARELHDETGSVLTALQMNLERVELQVPEDVKPLLQDNRGIVDRLLNQVRRMSLDLRPSVLDDLGLVAAIRWYARERLQSDTLTVKLELPASIPRLTPEIENAGFRMVQSAATNTVRHANAGTLEISLRLDAADLHLSVRDNGAGFDVAAAQSRSKGGFSLGLLAMEERVILAGGRFILRSAPGEGTEVSANFRVKLRAKK